MTSILITIVLTALLVSSAVASPAELPHYNYLQKRADPVIASGFTKTQQLQIKDAILDARMLMIYAIKDLQHDGTGVFASYFRDDEKSKTTVRRVFETLLGGEPHQGNLNNSPSLPPFGSSALANITIRTDYFLAGDGYRCQHPEELAFLSEAKAGTARSTTVEGPPDPDWITKPPSTLVSLPGNPPITGHSKGRPPLPLKPNRLRQKQRPPGPPVPPKPNHLRELSLKDFDGLHPKLVICPRSFDFGGINKGYEGEGGPHAITCDTVGGRVSYSMDVLGSTLLHEYLHFHSMFTPEVLPHNIIDVASGPYNCRLLSNPAPFFNADSYTWYATEVYWTMACGENFREPSPYDDHDPRCGCDVCHA